MSFSVGRHVTVRKEFLFSLHGVEIAPSGPRKSEGRPKDDPLIVVHIFYHVGSLFPVTSISARSVGTN